MNLSNLRPQKGQTEIRNALEEVKEQVMAILLAEDTRVLNPEVDTAESVDSKVVKCRYNVVYLNSVSPTQIE